MKTRYKITIVIIIAFIPISVLFPQVFLVFHLDKYETNATCDALNGNWDWIHDTCDFSNKCDALNGNWDLINGKCVFKSNESISNEQQCEDLGGMPACAPCGGEVYYNPWNAILPSGCLSICIPVCEFSQDDKEYENTETTCNDSLGKPDGECFVNAFKKCESASIKQRSGTLEGDLIYQYATIIPDDSCSIHYKLDVSRDRFKGVFVGNIETTCTDVQIIDTQMFLQCIDKEQMIPLR